MHPQLHTLCQENDLFEERLTTNFQEHDKNLVSVPNLNHERNFYDRTGRAEVNSVVHVKHRSSTITQLPLTEEARTKLHSTRIGSRQLTAHNLENTVSANNIHKGLMNDPIHHNQNDPIHDPKSFQSTRLTARYYTMITIA